MVRRRRHRRRPGSGGRSGGGQQGHLQPDGVDDTGLVARDRDRQAGQRAADGRQPGTSGALAQEQASAGGGGLGGRPQRDDGAHGQARVLHGGEVGRLEDRQADAGAGEQQRAPTRRLRRPGPQPAGHLDGAGTSARLPASPPCRPVVPSPLCRRASRRRTCGGGVHAAGVRPALIRLGGVPVRRHRGAVPGGAVLLLGRCTGRLHGCTAARLHGCTAARLHGAAAPGSRAAPAACCDGPSGASTALRQPVVCGGVLPPPVGLGEGLDGVVVALVDGLGDAVGAGSSEAVSPQAVRRSVVR